MTGTTANPFGVASAAPGRTKSFCMSTISNAVFSGGPIKALGSGPPIPTSSARPVRQHLHPGRGVGLEQCPPHPFGARRHVHLVDVDGVVDGVHDRGRCGEG